MKVFALIATLLFAGVVSADNHAAPAAHGDKAAATAPAATGHATDKAATHGEETKKKEAKKK